MDRLLTRDDVARILGVSRDHFDDMRKAGGGPKETRLGHRTLRFRPQDVDAWLIERQNAA
jgi:excisionase family DNA binding protein